MRQVQRDSWRKKVFITSLLCSMMKVIFPSIGVSITQKRTPLKLISFKNKHVYNLNNSKTHVLKTHIPQNLINAQTKQLKNSCPQKLKFLQLILQNATYPTPHSSENSGRKAVN